PAEGFSRCFDLAFVRDLDAQEDSPRIYGLFVLPALLGLRTQVARDLSKLTEKAGVIVCAMQRCRASLTVEELKSVFLDAFRLEVLYRPFGRVSRCEYAHQSVTGVWEPFGIRVIHVLVNAYLAEVAIGIHTRSPWLCSRCQSYSHC